MPSQHIYVCILTVSEGLGPAESLDYKLWVFTKLCIMDVLS